MQIKHLEHLAYKKNLLAFSGGTDSSALFHLLVANNISFDVAIVNYNTRDTSNDEMQYAIDLVDNFNKTAISPKKCFTHLVDFSTHSSNFEKEARDIRYSFFDSLIEAYGYHNLITGHNLNDKMEWFLMQMTKGAGIKELFGMEPVSEKYKDGFVYTVVRPLIESSKNEILYYLKENNIKYFFDESNENEKYKRNFFRAHYANALISHFSKGIRRTFNILEKEVKDMNVNLSFVEDEEEYAIVSADDKNFVHVADMLMKKKGYVLSSSQREDLREDKEVMIGRDYVLSFSEGRLFYTPYVDVSMTKEFKNKMREQKVPIKNRPYFFSIGKDSF